ncbi:hypothetical protein SAMN05444405_11831 [Bacteroides luti]|jgi:hypothetical protein|uniref:Uncharacterized protein n=1 Tax=Bacteroides luti TaxID=1297750 RepID=A0A1M5FWN8_9BACE|nr:HEPN domain-containing protein [Bacteroides luti]SHF95918.1 hypothetical protein SAMN05444405_11831 [Bacteroides luti]
MEKRIYIRGNILITATHKLKYFDMICLADESYAEDATKVIEGDIVIDNNYETFSDTTYIASGGITQITPREVPDMPEDILATYKYSIENLEKLLTLHLTPEMSFTLNQQLFIGAFGAMEAFLCDMCLCFIKRSPIYTTNYLKICPSLKNEKIKLCDIFEEYTKIESRINECAQDMVYHNLWIVKSIFEGTFNIKFPSISAIVPYIETRHDLVHRNGKSKDGSYAFIDLHKLKSLISEINKFVESTFDAFKECNL